MEIISGVHKIDGVRGANCYLVSSGPEMILVVPACAAVAGKSQITCRDWGKIRQKLDISLLPIPTPTILAAPWK